MAAIACAGVRAEWEPPEPDFGDEYDWVELTSGEWLKGDFRYLYEDKVEFDSDKLGVLKLDWSDIKRVRFAGPMGVRLNDREVRRGHAMLEDGKVLFWENAGSPEGYVSASQDQVVSIAPAATDEIERWRLKAKLSADIQRGNTDETRYTGKVDVERRTASSRLSLGYLGNYTVTDSASTTNNHRATVQFDYYFDQRLYVRPVSLSYYRDPFSNISFQMTVGAGVGYKAIDSKDLEWELYAGPAYQYTRFSNVESGQSQEAQSPAAVLGSDFDYTIVEDLDYKLSYQATFSNQASGLYTHHIVTSLEYKITSIFDIFVMLQWDHIQKPSVKSDGTTPDPDDVTLSMGLGVDI